jgi:hypothetical protein
MARVAPSLLRKILPGLLLLAQGAGASAFSDFAPPAPAETGASVRRDAERVPSNPPGGKLSESGQETNGSPAETLFHSSPPEVIPDTEWVWFSSRGRVFQPLLADPMEALFRLSFLYEGRDRRWDADLTFGGDVGLLWARLPANRRLSLTVRGLVSSRFEVFSESFDLLNTDFLGGLALGYARAPNSFEFLVFHQSSHLGDEILGRQARSRIDYGKEAARLLWARGWKGGRVYAGLAFTLHALPEELEHAFTLQGGVEDAFQVWKLAMFVALDLQSRQEHDWSPNVAAKWGVWLGNPRKVRNRQWVFLSCFHGFSNMGQFYDVRETCGMIGVGYRFR